MSSPNELSFLPDDYLERKAQRRTNAICAILFLVVMVAIGTAFTFTERAGVEVEKEHAAVQKRYTEAAKRIQLKQQLEDKQATMEKQAELSASLLEKVPRSYMLAKITNSLPPGVSLFEMVMDSKVRANPAASAAAKTTLNQRSSAKNDPKKAAAPVIQQAKTYDVGLRITGVAATDVQVGRFINNLNQLKLFRDVNLIISDQLKDSDPPVRKFTLEAALDPAAEVNPDAMEKPKTAAVEIKETP